MNGVIFVCTFRYTNLGFATQNLAAELPRKNPAWEESCLATVGCNYEVWRATPNTFGEGDGFATQNLAALLPNKKVQKSYAL